jgi:hypothetical protein
MDSKEAEDLRPADKRSSNGTAGDMWGLQEKGRGGTKGTEYIMFDQKPEEAIKEAEEMAGKNYVDMKDEEFNPIHNPEAISIIKQKDGNFKLWGQRFGKVIELRAGKPEDALVAFLTHE